MNDPLVALSSLCSTRNPFFLRAHIVSLGSLGYIIRHIAKQRAFFWVAVTTYWVATSNQEGGAFRIFDVSKAQLFIFDFNRRLVSCTTLSSSYQA
jgi:hypothetical protein